MLWSTSSSSQKAKTTLSCEWWDDPGAVKAKSYAFLKQRVVKAILKFGNIIWESFYVYSGNCMDDLIKKHARKIRVWMQKTETGRFCVYVCSFKFLEISAKFQGFFSNFWPLYSCKWISIYRQGFWSLEKSRVQPSYARALTCSWSKFKQVWFKAQSRVVSSFSRI